MKNAPNNSKSRPIPNIACYPSASAFNGRLSACSTLLVSANTTIFSQNIVLPIASKGDGTATFPHQYMHFIILFY